MKGLDSTQIEQLKQIAEYLYHQREDQEISLEKVAKETFIPLRLLQAMESSQFERLPEPVYIKGFIRRYADALGLDGTEIADAFEVEPAPLAQPAEPRPEPPAPPPEPVAVDPPEQIAPSVSRPSIPQYDRVSPVSAAATEPEPRPSYLPWVISGIAAIVAVAAVAIAMSQFNKSAPSSTASSSPKTSTTQSLTPKKPKSSPSASRTNDSATQSSSNSVDPLTPSPEASPTPTDSASPNPLSSPPGNTTENGPFQVDIKLTDPSWIEVVADGKVEFADVIPKGEQRTWKAKKSLMIRAGNAGAVVASYNGGEAKPMGKEGAVVDMSFPKQQ